MKALFSKLSIRYALMLLIVSFSLTAVIIGTVTVYLYTKTTMEKESAEYAENIFEGMSSNISLTAERVYSIAQFMQSRTDIYELLTREQPYDKTYQDLEGIFDKIITKDGIIFAMDFIDNKGNVYRFGNKYIKSNISAEYLSGFNSYSLLFSQDVIPYNGEYYCILGNTIYNYFAGIKCGKAVFYINGSLFGGNMSYYDSDAVQNTFFVSVDDTVITCSEKKAVGKKLYLPEEIIENNVAMNDDYSFFNYNPNIPLVANNIKITSLIRNKWLFKTMNSVIVWILLGMTVIVFAALITAWILSRHLSKDIVNLAEWMKKTKFENITEEQLIIPGKKNEIKTLYDNFNIMCAKISDLIKEINAKNKQQMLTEINLLQSQINPHFLYNALDVISWKAKENEEYEIDDMIINLATFLRLGLHSGKNIVKVREELEHVKCYLQIEQERFPELFETKYEVEEKILDYDMVKVVLQPIVENAIKHGFRNINYKGLIIIRGYENGENIIFEIEDNGMGVRWDEELKFPQSENPLGGYGLYNIDRRLSIYYEDDYSIGFHSEPGKGTTVRLKIGKKIRNY